MSTHDTRRDERFELRPGSSSVEFPVAKGRREVWLADLISISTAGLRLRVDAVPTDVGVGTFAGGVRVRIGDCLIGGDVVIKSAAQIDETGTELGCLFYPKSGEDEDRWMTIVAGLEAALPDPVGDRR